MPDYTFVGILAIIGFSATGLVTGFIIRKVNQWLTKNKNDDQQKNQTTNSLHEISKDSKKLIQWLHKEQAITEPNQDGFDMAVQARNISKLLLETPLKTAALVGEYGSGKSSILKMVDYYLKPENRNELTQNNGNYKNDSVNQEIDVITCTVDGWGFAKGSMAEHILECAINELSKHVDVSGLRTVPEQYVAAMDSAGNVFLKILAALATRWKSPLDILKRIDNVLIAIDKRLIIFLEDVDRNKNDEVFFNEIAALLDGLRQLKQVSFVLAIGQKYDAEEVLIKTAEHVENIPRLNRFDVLNTLELFRSYCLERRPDVINSIPKNYNKDRMGWDRTALVQAVIEIYYDLPNPVDAILELTDNPRVLKHALRRTLTAWKKLAGEIDFDDLLIVNVLKVVDERIFSFIDKNISRLCALATDNEKKSQDELRKKLEPEYKQATEKADYDVNAVSKLVKALFPKFIGESTTDELLRRDLTSYQHVANDEPTKYWERIKRGELYDNEIADCETLRALRQWNKDHESKAFRDMEMFEALFNDESIFKKVLQFKSLISRDCLQKTASKQFDKTLKEYGNKASREVCPALTRLFVLKPEYDDKLWRNWLLEEIKKALPISLRYAYELYHFWYDPKHNPDGDLRGRVVEEAKKIYENDPALLAKVLDPDYIWSVFNFTESFAEKNKDTRTIDSKQWMWLGRTLIEASADNPQIIGVHIAAMASSMSSYNREKQIEYENKFYQTEVKSIFNDQEYKAMKLLLLEDVDIEKYDETSKKVLLCARDEATKWLKQNNGQPKDNHVQ
jgi:energy-coupling factor transporter ATP-binding protein EcfA2